jgi:hypothetical protein
MTKPFHACLLGAAMIAVAGTMPATAEPALCAPPPVTLADGPYVLRLMQDLVTARSMERDGACSMADGTGAYAGHMLADCTYVAGGRRRIVERKGKLEAVPDTEKAAWKGRVLMLNATPEVLAEWTREACSAAEKEIKNCALDICDYVKDQSAAQFPVKGVVIEPDRVIDGKSATGGDVNIVFRDGVTVVTGRSRAFARSPEVSGRSFPGRGLTEAEMGEILDEEYTGVREIRNFARVGGVTAQCYQQNRDRDARIERRTPEDPVIEGGKPSLRWLEVSRDSYLAALARPSEGYEMFRILARSLRRKGGTTGGFDLVCK